MDEGSRTESPGAALVRLRWAKTTPEERQAYGRMMARARLRKLGKVRSKSKRSKSRKSTA